MAESAPETANTAPSTATMRLQRALAAAGIASRRQCEQIIREGRVDVDGTTVTELGTKVDPQRQKITVDGQPIRRRRHVYFMLNKPPGVLSTSHDESGRMRAIDLIDSTERVYTVGRLDKSSEGLIVITNDGDLANQLTHPRYGVEKTYLVRVVGQPSIENLNRLRAGIHLAEAYARVAEVRVKKQLQNCTDLEILLKEGRNREIRRVMASLGHKVVLLKRIAIGPIRLGEMPRGAFRELTPSELDALRGAATKGGKGSVGKRKPRRGGSWSKPAKYSARVVGETPRRKFGQRTDARKAISPAGGTRRGSPRGKAGPTAQRSISRTKSRPGPGLKTRTGRRLSRTKGRRP